MEFFSVFAYNFPFDQHENLQHLSPGNEPQQTFLLVLFFLKKLKETQLVPLLPDGLRVTSCSLSLSPSRAFGTQQQQHPGFININRNKSKETERRLKMFRIGGCQDG